MTDSTIKIYNARYSKLMKLLGFLPSTCSFSLI
ncbi:Capsular polysaccharide synthesis enzyme CpsA [Klebsiella pneumoniae]|nr:Capsular polysaccharide synthesis enzyme CpsA [Klebsiella pneumoniae]